MILHYIKHILLRTNNIMNSIYILSWFFQRAKSFFFTHWLLKTSSLVIHLRQLFTKTHVDCHSLPLHTRCFMLHISRPVCWKNKCYPLVNQQFFVDSLTKMLPSACGGFLKCPLLHCLSIKYLFIFCKEDKSTKYQISQSYYKDYSSLIIATHFDILLS